MLIGWSRPSSGTITFDGIDAVRDIKKAQSIMGIVPDENNPKDCKNRNSVRIDGKRRS